MKLQRKRMGLGQVVLAAFTVSLFFVLAASVRPAEGFTITTNVESGSGTIKPTSPTVAAGKKKTLRIKPAKGWHVARITLDGAAVYDKDERFVDTGVKKRKKKVKYKLTNVTADHTVTATFEENRTYSLRVSVSGNGFVKVRPGGKKCVASGDACVATFTEDQAVRLSAKPSGGYLFTGWGNGASGIRKKNKIVMNGDKTITATFMEKSAAASALKVAEKISVVDAKSAGSGHASPGGTAASVPADSDYVQDETFSFVEEDSVETFDIMNEILCMMAQTKYEEMLNEGPYKAMVDMNQCETERDDASKADGADSKSSGSSMPDYETWTVDSRRKNNAAPHIVKAWVHESEDGRGGDGEGEHASNEEYGDDDWEPAKLIYTKTVITEGASDLNPYGIFTMNFDAYPIKDSAAVVSRRRQAETVGNKRMFKGYLKAERDASGDVLLKFVAESGEGSSGEQFNEKATLNRYETGGRGSTQFRFAFGPYVEQGSYDIAFSDDYFLRSDGTESLCLDRNNFEETAWRYGLYDSTTGSRVNPQSGFPVKVTDNGREYYGWIGFWGMWFPEELTLESGSTVYKQDFGGGEPVAYQLFVAQGKLRKHTKKLLTLGDIKNIPLDWWEESERKNYRTIWNGTDFRKVAFFDEDVGMWSELQTAQVVSLSGLSWDTLFLWSHALGGNVRVKLTCTSDENNPGEPSFDCSASDSSNVVFYAESVVFPSDTVPSTLACFSQCPNGANTATGSVFFDDSQLHYQDTAPAGASYISYSFNQESMLLTYGGADIIQTVENENNPWDVRSGPLFEPTQANLEKLACDWDQSGTSTCGWQAWDNMDEYYTWETGPNDWTRFSALKNSAGEFERFEPPLSVQYEHEQTDTSAPDYKYNGATFYLEYNGFGDLHGIPGKCVDHETGEDTSCGPNTRWIPEFTIPDGSLVEGEDKSYLVKALEKEQRMQSVELSECSSLRLVSYTLPSISEWSAPNIGKEPTLDGPPAVVGGVVQQ